MFKLNLFVIGMCINILDVIKCMNCSKNNE